MEKLAIIKNVNIGVGDYGEPALWFDTYTSQCSAALQVFGWKEAGEIIKKSGLRSVDSLEGMSCIVEEDAGLLRWKGLSGI